MVQTKTRKIVHIDEAKCNGCGACVPSCAEGALRIVDGKAKLLAEKYCDGLGACLGQCPQDAITVEERAADSFDEEAVTMHLAERGRDTTPCACPSASVAQFDIASQAHPAGDRPHEGPHEGPHQPSLLTHWPVQLTLVPPGAPFLKGADVVLAAHCVPFAHADFHRDFLPGHSLLVACPKLDDFRAHLLKLTEVLKKSDIRSLTVVHMEVPCCSGLGYLAREAIKLSGKDIPVSDVTIGIKGGVKAA
jgi:NAD-dependent dihydropyrimidine dehydrogenase PreA subunit